MTVEEFTKDSAEYLSCVKNTASPCTYRNYSNVLRTFSEYLNTEKPKAITSVTVTKWKDALLASGRSVNTVVQYLRTLRPFFEWEIEHGIITTNPVKSEKIPKRKQVKNDLLSKAEIEQLLTAHPDYGGNTAYLRNRAIVLLFLCSGLRSGELRGLRVTDLDYETKTVLVRHGKGDKERRVPFPRVARQAVQDYLYSGYRPKFNDLLFGSYDSEEERTNWHEMTQGRVYIIVEEYVERVTGHSGIGAHDLRHAAASMWDDMGISMREIQNALGHSSIVTTERIYVEILNKGKSARKVAEEFDKVV